MAYVNEWFNDRQALQAPPPQCVHDCSRPGQDASEAVDYWVDRLQLDGPAWLIREHLSGYGAWEPGQLANHQANLGRLLWLWCCDLREDPDSGPLYLMR